MNLDKRDAVDRAAVHIQENTDVGLPRGFRTRFQQSYDAFVNESWSISGDLRLQEKYDEELEKADLLGIKLRHPYDTSEVPAYELGRDLSRGVVTKQARDYDEQVLELRKKNPASTLKTSDELMKDIQEEARILRERNAIGAKNTTAGGKAGGVLGVMAGAVTDPVVLATLPFGAGRGPQALTFAQQVLRAGMIEGGIATGTELAIQPSVYQYKKEIESPYTVSDAALNVILAGGAGSILGAGFRGLGEFWRAYRKNRPERPLTALERDAEKVVEDTVELMEANPYERTLDGERAHQTNAEAAAEAIVRGETLDHMPAEAPRRLEHRASELNALDPESLKVDPERFQFKSGADAQGVTERLQGVEEFDPKLAGVALVYEQADGARYIVDGHQRLALAKRAKAGGQKNVRLNSYLLREVDGISDGEARAIAAFKNIAEGTGSAGDAAKIIREVGERGLPPLPPRSSLVRIARDLAQLNEFAFGMVVNGLVPENYAAIVGRLVRDERLQTAIMDVLHRAEPENINQAESIVRQAMFAGTHRMKQEGLFDDSFFDESLFFERARLLDHSVKKLRRDKNLFKTLVKGERDITAAGNVLDSAANREKVIDNDQILEAVQRLANTKGQISDLLTEGARQLREGKRIGKLSDDFIQSLRQSSDEIAAHGRSVGRSRRDGEVAAQTDELTSLREEVPDEMKAIAEDPQLAEDMFRNAEALVENKITQRDIDQLIDTAETKIKIGDQEVGLPDEVLDALEEQRTRIKENGESILDQSPERIALREKIVNDLYGSGARNKDLRADIVIGMPASGKSTGIADPLVQANGSLLIDADEVKKLLPEFEGGKRSGEVHEESSMIMEQVLEEALTAGDNIVLPVVGKTFKKLKNKIDALHQIGYKVYLHHAQVPPDLALRRGIRRFYTRGRLVDPYYIASVGSQPFENFNKLRSQVDGYANYSTQVPPGQPVRILEASDPSTINGLGELGGQPPASRTRPGEGQPIKGDESELDAEPDLFASTEDPEFEVPIGQRVDDETGELVSETITAEDMVKQARDLEAAANAVEACLRK